MGVSMTEISTCSDTDFNTALELVKILIQHTAKVFVALPGNAESQQKDYRKTALLSALPPEFDKKEFLQIANQLNIPPDTVNKYLKQLVNKGSLTKLAHGKYQKTNLTFHEFPEDYAFYHSDS